jgi:BMFP domain-containing protein YqiC
MALLLFAEHHEDKLEKRIKTLEKKLEDKEKGGGE